MFSRKWKKKKRKGLYTSDVNVKQCLQQYVSGIAVRVSVTGAAGLPWGGRGHEESASALGQETRRGDSWGGDLGLQTHFWKEMLLKGLWPVGDTHWGRHSPEGLWPADDHTGTAVLGSIKQLGGSMERKALYSSYCCEQYLKFMYVWEAKLSGF